jgi:glycosyltransferase involved in cell wall biosynthesis
MKVLIGAYACAPNTGSEGGVGWNWAAQAARHGHDVHVITRANNRPVIEQELHARPVDRLRFHYYDLPAPLPSWKKRGGYYALLTYYYLWQLGVATVARRLSRTHSFDLTHHVTFVNDWMPAGVGWTGAPFIWGPVGGSTNVLPPSMREFIPKDARRYEAIRRTMQVSLRSIDPFVAMTRRRANVILTFTREAREGIPWRHRTKARAIVHIGVSPSELDAPTTEPGTNDVFTIVSGSRLVHWKGFDLLIEAFARFRKSNVAPARLLITGEGPFRTELERTIRRLALEDSVRLLGHLPSRSEVYRVVASADLYALPTLRDGPPVAILEAMHAGRPILCLDRGSTAEMVPEHAGFKIPVRDRAQVVSAIADALTWAATHADELRTMGIGARKHALERHDWERIGESIDALYREVAAARPSSS